MPWIKTFDTDEVLEKAGVMFASKGFEATSISDLTQAMGINKGSLYHAFGSKRDLFEAVIRKDVMGRQATAFRQLEGIGDPIVAISAIFDGAIAQNAGSPPNAANLIIITALDLPAHSDGVRDIVKFAVRNLEMLFARLIDQGHESGAISGTTGRDCTAKALVALLTGCRVFARGTYETADLLDIKNCALKLLGADPKFNSREQVA